MEYTETDAHAHIANIYILFFFFFWQKSRLMAEVDIASLSALCSLPHLILPGALPHHPICMI